ncbi:hypothetical protein [Absicoccus intestinalis]|uniref:Uncharacterized protein n=1 Tax=Absicoccus intestinalis TaxID=2926319 RepID=A0ABU4WKB4_9FIRM|nr:hypothetical protein [Absicoccus sp. CLA-KB-P134]MDX8416987.1 hypothetical protein [Absicoccus sp. CLA-KB-P134]
MDEKLKQSVNSALAPTIKNLQESLKSSILTYNSEYFERISKNVSNAFNDSPIANKITSEFIDTINELVSSLNSIDLDSYSEDDIVPNEVANAVKKIVTSLNELPNNKQKLKQIIIKEPITRTDIYNLILILLTIFTILKD